MSKEQAMAVATNNQPQVAEARVSPVTGVVPADAKTAANPAVENGGVVPPSLLSTQLSHMAKKEAKFLAEREAFKKEQEEFKTLKTKVQEVYDKATAFENTRKVDPIRAMKEIGFSEEEIVDYLSREEAPKPTTEAIVQAELKKFKDEEAKKVEEARKVQDSKVISEFRNQIGSTISSAPDKYEVSLHHGPVAEQLIFDIATIEAIEQGKLPENQRKGIDIKSIADDVEAFYAEGFEAMKKLKKFTPKEAVQIAKAEVERSRVVHPPQDTVKPKATTLTNKITATAAAAAKPARAETREEKRTRIENMIRAGFTR